MDVLDDPKEMGRLVAAARAYSGLNQAEFGKRIGRSDKTMGNIERGELSSLGGTREERRQLAERVVAASSCPAEWFDLEGAPPDRVGEMQSEINGLAKRLTDLELKVAAQVDIEDIDDPAKVAEADAARRELEERERESLRKAEEAAEVADDQGEEPADTAEPRT